jgi:hypothetical protein
VRRSVGVETEVGEGEAMGESDGEEEAMGESDGAEDGGRAAAGVFLRVGNEGSGHEGGLLGGAE